MGAERIATAVKRVEAALKRRPDKGLHADAPATARWQGGTRIVASNGNGASVLTDMPDELGGSGDQVTPGWLFRAGVASCLATSIALTAAVEGIEIITLEVTAASRSDTRGLLGMADERGEAVCAAPVAVELNVRIGARGAAGERLRELVERSRRCSPIPVAVQQTVPVTLNIDVDQG
jgi:organic hydroperoxide reductase OsmC/OhrA